MKRWFISTLVATAVLAMVAVGCSSSSGGDTTTADTAGPVFTSPKDVNIDENTVYVTTLTAKDASLPITFEITGGYDMSKFQLNGDNQLKFIVAPDFETPGSDQNNPEYIENKYDVKVKATDALGYYREQSITVTVFNTDAPGFISNPDVTVDENTLTVTTVSVQGEDPAGLVSLAMTGGDDETLFDFNPTSGLLKFITAPDFENPADNGLNNIYNVEITATEGSASVIQQMEITVVNLGEAILQIASAVYDDNGTDGTTADDSLFVYFDRQIDDASWAVPAFGLTGSAAIAGATFEYTPDLPYKLTVTDGLSGFVPNTTSINVVTGGFTVDGQDVNASSPVTVTAMQVVVQTGDRDFVLTGNTITDNDLGVAWQTDVVPTAYTWSEAIAACEASELNSDTDWRVPSIQELVSITNKTAFAPAIYDEFNQTDPLYFWSSTSYFENDAKAWLINVGTGGDGGGGSTTKLDKTTHLYVRCVRGDVQAETTFIRDSATKVVYDTKSGLIWDDSEQTQEDTNLTWAEAKTYCENNTLGSYATWRVPTFSELEGIVNYGTFDPSISGEFINANSYGHWTSTEDANTSTNKAWTIRFSGGESELQDKEVPSRQQSVRCVTDGQ